MQHICKINIRLTDGIITIIAPPPPFRCRPMQMQMRVAEMTAEAKIFTLILATATTTEAMKKPTSAAGYRLLAVGCLALWLYGCCQSAMAQMTVPGSGRTAWQANLSIGRPRWVRTQSAGSK